MDTLKIVDIDFRQFDNVVATFIVDQPPENLLTIYEKRVLGELAYIKAEFYDSPENAGKIDSTTTIKRNYQNPNFTTLMKMYEELKGTKDFDEFLQIINKIIKFINNLGIVKIIDYQPTMYRKNLDVRCCQNLEMYFNYQITVFVTTVKKNK